MSTYLITGSNRGIGLELCRQIHKRGDNVIATCRKASKELRDLGVRIEENIEISSDESITCLLYTSDAADDLTRVDLGGRRIIKI